MKLISKYYIITIIFFLFTTCALDLPEDALDYLAAPWIISVTQVGNKIDVTFGGTNTEYYFDGYNAYISTTAMLKPSVPTYKPVQVEGCASCTPSYPLMPGTYSRTIRLYHYYDSNNDVMSFSTGKYYIRLGSHHRFLGVNEDGVSNEVSIDFL